MIQIIDQIQFISNFFNSKLVLEFTRTSQRQGNEAYRLIDCPTFCPQFQQDSGADFGFEFFAAYFKQLKMI